MGELGKAEKCNCAELKAALNLSDYKSKLSIFPGFFFFAFRFASRRLPVPAARQNVAGKTGGKQAEKGIFQGEETFTDEKKRINDN